MNGIAIERNEIDVCVREQWIDLEKRTKQTFYLHLPVWGLRYVSLVNDPFGWWTWTLNKQRQRKIFIFYKITNDLNVEINENTSQEKCHRACACVLPIASLRCALCTMTGYVSDRDRRTHPSLGAQTRQSQHKTFSVSCTMYTLCLWWFFSSLLFHFLFE